MSFRHQDNRTVKIGKLPKDKNGDPIFKREDYHRCKGTGKKVFSTKKAAMNAMNSSDKGISWYKCPSCRNFHLTGGEDDRRHEERRTHQERYDEAWIRLGNPDRRRDGEIGRRGK